MQWHQIWTSLERKDIALCYLFAGEETYLIKQTVDKIKDALNLPKCGELDIQHLDASEASFDVLATACMQLPWLAQRRLVIVHGISFSDNPPDWLGDLSHLITRLALSTCLILCVRGRLNMRHKVVVTAAKEGVVAEFPRLKGREMEKWASRRSKELGIRWGNGALSYFLMRVIPHLEQIETELQKICTYAGANTIISPGEIDDLVAESRGSRVFALSDAMLAKDKEKGLKIIDDLLRQGETPIGLVGLLAHQIRVLGQIKGALEQGVQGSEISKMFGFHPFVVQKTMSPCDHFTWEQLYGALQTLSRADIKLKSTNLSDKLVLEEAILSI